MRSVVMWLGCHSAGCQRVTGAKTPHRREAGPCLPFRLKSTLEAAVTATSTRDRLVQPVNATLRDELLADSGRRAGWALMEKDSQHRREVSRREQDSIAVRSIES